MDGRRVVFCVCDVFGCRRLEADDAIFAVLEELAQDGDSALNAAEACPGDIGRPAIQLAPVLDHG